VQHRTAKVKPDPKHKEIDELQNHAMKPIPSVNGERHFICKATRASLGGDEQPPPLLTSRAPLQFCLPSIHDIIVILLETNETKS